MGESCRHRAALHDVDYSRSRTKNRTQPQDGGIFGLIPVGRTCKLRKFLKTAVKTYSEGRRWASHKKIWFELEVMKTDLVKSAHTEQRAADIRRQSFEVTAKENSRLGVVK